MTAKPIAMDAGATSDAAILPDAGSMPPDAAPDAGIACAEVYTRCTQGDFNRWRECLADAERCGLVPPGSTCSAELWNCANTPDPIACVALAAQCASGAAPL